jgi:Na+-translocating ferredoxin:NAD+ oxidoreductase RnfC subunit
LIQRLDLKKYDVEAPLSQSEYKPDMVVIPLKQHVGAPATALVTKGTAVEKGALIAGMEDGKMGANIHASISGTVTDVSDQSIVIRSN